MFKILLQRDSAQGMVGEQSLPCSRTSFVYWLLGASTPHLPVNTDTLPFAMTDEARVYLLDAIAHPPAPNQQAALVWSSELAYIDEDHPNDLSLGSGFCVRFYPPGSQPPDASCFQLSPSHRLSVSARSLVHLRDQRLEFVTRRVNLRAGRTKAVRVLIASAFSEAHHTNSA